MLKLTDLIRPDLREFAAYSSARDEAKQGKIWLNANESPYSYEIGGEIGGEIESQIQINRYPEKQPKKLLEELAKLYKVENSQIVVSRGSDEVIDLLIRLFCSSGKDSIMIFPPTFGMYAVCAKLQAAQVIAVPLLKNKAYQLDLTSIVQQVNPNVKILFLCSPNNPTGNLLNKTDILSLCEKLKYQSIIVVDEAYLEFADAESLSSYIEQYPNLVILRTLSKAYGLAGARCGVLLAQADLVQWILKIMPPYPLPAFTSQLILQTIMAKQKVQQQINIIKSERTRLFESLTKLACVKTVWHSDANFLLVETVDAEKVMHICANDGIILRNMHDKPGLENCVRISIGLPAENDQVVALLNKLVNKLA